MKNKKLAALITSGLLLLGSSTTFAASRLMQPYENPQGIYEDNDVKIQMDIDADFHILLSISNKTNSTMKINLDRANVFFTSIAEDFYSDVHEIGNKNNTNISAKGHTELDLSASLFEGLQLPCKPGLGVKLSLPIRILNKDKEYNFIF